jgi:hypothetical protein
MKCLLFQDWRNYLKWSKQNKEFIFFLVHLFNITWLIKNFKHTNTHIYIYIFKSQKSPIPTLFRASTSFHSTLQKIFIEEGIGRSFLICVVTALIAHLLSKALFLCKYPCIMLQAIVRPAPVSRHLYAFFYFNPQLREWKDVWT